METPTIADIGMRLLVPVPDYETAGKLMDAVQAAVGVALGHHELNGRVEFVRFNILPCNAARMGGHARHVSEKEVQLGAGRQASARGNTAMDGTRERA